MRVLVDLGATARRNGRRPEALGHLRLALDLAARGGMLRLARRCREELRACVSRPRRSAVSGVESLTPAEHRVGALAARGSTNREIAQELYVATRTVETHLTSVFRKLLLRIVEKGIQNYLDAITPVVESGEPAAARLRGAISAHMGVLARTIEQTRVAVHQWTYLSPENQQEVAGMRRRYEELFDRILREGIAAGDFREMRHPRVAVLSTIGMLNSVTQWYSPDGPLSAEEIGEVLADNALVGLQNLS